MKGIFLILLFLFLGEVASWLISGLIPGSVLGMVFLFLSLLTGLVRADDVRPVALWLTRNMALFFVPASIGVMAAWPMISAHWGALAIIAVGTTLLVVAVVGLIQERAMRRAKANASLESNVNSLESNASLEEGNTNKLEEAVGNNQKEGGEK